MARTAIAMLVVTLCATSACSTSPMPTPPRLVPVTHAPTAIASQVDLNQVAARAAHTATALPSGEILIAGGCIIDGCGTATDATFLVSSDGATAVDGPRLSNARDSQTATLLDGRVYIAAGFPGEGAGTLSSVDMYDASSRTMAPFGTLTTARGGHAAAVLGDSAVLIVGGWIRSHTYTPTAEAIDPAHGIVPLPDAPWAADALDAVTLADGRVLVTGGQIRPAVATDEAAIYDPASGSWTAVGPMGTPRLKHTTVLLDDGRVLVIGGSPDDEHLLSTTELFDPLTNMFTPGPDLVEPRYKMPGGAVALPGNRVLIAGGGRNVELLDVGQSSSQIVHHFGVRGSFTTVTPLGDGQWLVVGGYDDRIALTNSYAVLNLPAS